MKTERRSENAVLFSTLPVGSAYFRHFTYASFLDFLFPLLKYFTINKVAIMSDLMRVKKFPGKSFKNKIHSFIVNGYCSFKHS